jgi:hypothetical protein
MIISVSTLIIGNGAATPLSLVNFSMRSTLCLLPNRFILVAAAVVNVSHSKPESRFPAQPQSACPAFRSEQPHREPYPTAIAKADRHLPYTIVFPAAHTVTVTEMENDSG